MGKVIADITMSLDGYVTGPNDGVGVGLGEGGERLHNWVMGGEWTYEGEHAFEAKGVDKQIIDEMATLGASIIGRRMFDVTDGWGGTNPFEIPVFVLSHREPPAKLGPDYHFVKEGLASAVEQAQKAAGDNVIAIAGGANVIQQALRAGVVDELRVHIAPVILDAGKRLFEHIGTEVRLGAPTVLESPFATHLRYPVLRD